MKTYKKIQTLANLPNHVHKLSCGMITSTCNTVKPHEFFPAPAVLSHIMKVDELLLKSYIIDASRSFIEYIKDYIFGKETIFIDLDQACYNLDPSHSLAFYQENLATLTNNLCTIYQSRKTSACVLEYENYRGNHRYIIENFCNNDFNTLDDICHDFTPSQNIAGNHPDAPIYEL